jgi:2-C-methyl-D-erythritol 4-phosphate cytidylyltransferase
VDTFETAGVSNVVVVGDVPGGVPGGTRRRDSVAAGLAALDDVDWVFVHDAARPLATVRLVDSLLEAMASGHADGVIPVVPVVDTLKRVDQETVVETVDRSHLVAVQTPQLFSADVLRAAHLVDADEGVTDDAGLVERLGGTVKTVVGDPGNIKITHPSDLDLARAIFANRASP